MLQKAYLLQKSQTEIAIQKSQTEIAIYIEKKQMTFSIMYSFLKYICYALYEHMKQLPRNDLALFLF